MQNSGRGHLHVYGIRNCDSCRRAVTWLRSNSVPHTFHDIRDEALSRGLLGSWLESAYGALLLNRRSATWRKLGNAQRLAAGDDPLPLIMEHPTLLKRPVITDGKVVLSVGFDPARLETCV